VGICGGGPRFLRPEEGTLEYFLNERLEDVSGGMAQTVFPQTKEMA
jgi:hypothetical protein